jgi:hypothetical protein
VLSGVLAAVASLQAGRGLLAASAINRSLIGAIRWDAWYDSADGRVAQDVERSLGPANYHFRMPFFGKVTGSSSVRIDGAYQSIVDKEIEDASLAGIDYWAFCLYGPDDPMSVGLKLYLNSKYRSRIKFCVICGLNSTNPFYAQINAFTNKLFQETGYLDVLGNRPLVYLLSSSDDQITKEGGLQKVSDWLNDIRNAAHALGRGRPYFVLSEGNTARAKRLCKELEIDAIGLYATATGPFGGAPFEELAKATEASWDKLAETGIPIVPNIMTGWDTRPRHENPVSWEKHPGNETNWAHYYQDATPGEIASHVENALKWLAKHPAAAPANTALIYAWNECDEGFGALVPTYDPHNPDGDTSRLDAVAKVLSNWRRRR